MQDYVRSIVSHFDAKPIELCREYVWPPNKNAKSYFDTFNDRIVSSSSFLEDGSNRFEIASEILQWGGIHGRGEASIQKMASETPEQLIGRGFNGIASWSKIITLHDPQNYLIYDSRVAFAINAILRCSGFCGTYFPVPPSRRRGSVYEATRVANFTTSLEIEGHNFYDAYLKIMVAVGEKIGTPSWQIEMVLFARGPALAQKLTNELTKIPGNCSAGNYSDRCDNS